MIEPINISMNVSMHAVDRFSERAMDQWDINKCGVGIMSYLKNEAQKAYAKLLHKLDNTMKIGSCCIVHNDLVYVFATKFGKTSLVTVYLPNESQNDFYDF